MLRQITSLVIQNRGVKQLVNTKWVRPEYVPAYKPEKSGDLEGLPKDAEYYPGLDYKLSEELKE